MTITRVRCSRRSSTGGISMLLLGLVLAVWQARPLGAQESDTVAVREASRRFGRAERLMDPDSLRAILWADAVLQPPNGQRIEGREAILEFYARRALRSAEPAAASASGTPAPPASAAPARNSTPPSVPSGLVISATGDMAVQWGPGGRRSYLYHFMNIWERRGGEWRLLVNSWHLRAAPVTGPAVDTTGRSN